MRPRRNSRAVPADGFSAIGAASDTPVPVKALAAFSLMAWMCPACGTAIRHNEIEEQPRLGARHRCHICRLELVMDPNTARLIVVPLDESPDKRTKR